MYKVLNICSNILAIIPKYFRIVLLNSISLFRNKLFIALRYILLKSLSKECGNNVYTGHNIVFKYVDNMSIGSNVSIHENSHINARGGLIIGDNVSIAHNTTIITTNHTYNDLTKPIKYNPIELKQIVIGDDVWIGAGVRILAGLSIGSRVIVAAGSVVTKDIPSNVIVGGVPAKVLRELDK